nr:MAG TPA: hypothetical protein [Caudoviricetes sp.]
MIYPVVLDPLTFLEKESLFDFESFVWNEKSQDLDDFQLITPNLPKGFEEEGYISVPGSSKICMVTSIGYSQGTDGKLMYDIKGESVLGIYKYRPALPELRSTDYHSKVYPEGWEWGDKFSDLYNFDPRNIILDIWGRIDGDAPYKRAKELDFLKTPILMRPLTDSSAYHLPSRGLNYYSVGRNSTVWDVFQNLMKLGNFMLNTYRPGKYPKGVDLDTFPDGKSVLVSIDPFATKDSISISYGDYDAATQTLDKKDAANVVVNSVDDWVYLTKSNLGGKPRGLNARVRYFESDVKDLLEKELQMHVKDQIITETLNQHLQSATSDLTFSGNWFDKKPGTLVRVSFPWTREPTIAQVSEVVQTQDVNGYRTYPRLIPFSHPFVSTETENSNHKEFAHPSYFEFKDNLAKKTSWT